MTDAIRILHLYDAYLNIYADRGNIVVLQERARMHGFACVVQGLELGESFDPADVDLIYVGGGQDRDQALIAERMSEDLTDPITSAVDSGVALLAVCGGYQLLGEYYLDATGRRQPGISLMDLRTEAGEGRLIGNVAIECDLPAIGDRPATHTIVAGFENHGGRTSLGAAAVPFGRVLHGYGNDGTSGFEGCIVRRAIGTYLHGPLLPRNPDLADWLIAAAVSNAFGEDVAADVVTEPDELADQARSVVIERARSHKVRSDAAHLGR